MERQRNRPVKYDRELVQRSVKAMQKVEQVGGLAHASVSRWQPPWHAAGLQAATCAWYRAACDLLPCSSTHLMQGCSSIYQAARQCLQIRQARQDRFHEARMRRAAAQKNKAERAELEKGIDLIEAPVARLRKQQAAQAAAALQAEPEQVSAPNSIPLCVAACTRLVCFQCM